MQESLTVGRTTGDARPGWDRVWRVCRSACWLRSRSASGAGTTARARVPIPSRHPGTRHVGESRGTLAGTDPAGHEFRAACAGNRTWRHLQQSDGVSGRAGDLVGSKKRDHGDHDDARRTPDDSPVRFLRRDVEQTGRRFPRRLAGQPDAVLPRPDARHTIRVCLLASRTDSVGLVGTATLPAVISAIGANHLHVSVSGAGTLYFAAVDRRRTASAAL